MNLNFSPHFSQVISGSAPRYASSSGKVALVVSSQCGHLISMIAIPPIFASVVDGKGKMGRILPTYQAKALPNILARDN